MTALKYALPKAKGGGMSLRSVATREQMIEAIRRDFSKWADEDDTPKRTRTAWCSPGPGSARRWSLREIVEGVTAAVRLDDGRVFVGKVEAVNVERATIILRQWGREGPTRIPARRVVSACTVGHHTYAERAEVTRRQREGLPALVLGPRPVPPWCPPRSERDEHDDEDENE